MKHLLCATCAGIVATVCAGAARASSTTEPGFTTGVPLYAPQLPVGLYVDVVPDYSHRSTDPGTTFKALTPFFVLQTPVTLAGARIMVVAAPVFADLRVHDTLHASGMYNTYVGAQGTWNLGNNWGLGVRLAGWVPQHGEVALRYGTIAPRIGVTYYTPKEHFTASFERGWTLEGNGPHVAPNYANLDLTYTRTYKKFEIGVVSFLSADTDKPFLGYQKQSQAAIGPLIGYNFGRFQLEAKLTRDIYQSHYGGHENRAEFNITIPLWTPTVPAPDPVPVRP